MGHAEEAQEFQETPRDYFELLAAVEKAPQGVRFSERLVNFLCSLEAGGVLLEAVFEDEDVQTNFKLFKAMLLGSLVWGAGSHRDMQVFAGHASYLPRLDASIVHSAHQAALRRFQAQALELKALLDGIRRADHEQAAAAASQVRPGQQVAADLEFVAKCLGSLEEVLRRALTVFLKGDAELAQAFDPAHFSDLEGSGESEQLIGCLAESGFLQKRELVSLVFVE